MGDKKHFWEAVDSDHGSDMRDKGTQRARVEGGWLVRTTIMWSAKPSVAMVFMSDPEHKWRLGA